MKSRFLGLLIVFLLLSAACGSSGDENDEASSDEDEQAAFDGGEALTLDDNISDNGYADITLGRSLDDLRRTYGSATFVESEYGPDGVEAFTVKGLPQLQLMFVDQVLAQVDVTDPGLPSINGLHEVGHRRAEVVATYQERIASGEDLSITCTADNISARARSPFRLVFFTDDETIVRISSIRSEHIVPGEPCADIDDAGPVDDYVDASNESPEDDDFEQAEPPTVENFIPEAIDGVDAFRNPNTDQLSDEYAFLWWTAAHRFTALGIVGYADSIVSCLYRSNPPAFAVGVYLTDPLRLVVAVSPVRIPTLENLGCGVTEVIKDFICPNCLMLQPAGGGYVVDLEGETFAVAYVTMGGSEDKERMCDVLAYCRRTNFAAVPSIDN
ncbi:MAG: hypothetical protein ACR2N2_07440 [Acidimicrobiia bacterium]